MQELASMHEGESDRLVLRSPRRSGLRLGAYCMYEFYGKVCAGNSAQDALNGRH